MPSRRLRALAGPGRFAIIALFLGGLTTPLSAQATGAVEGYVYEDGTRTPVPGARIAVDGSNIGSLTNPDGYYQIVGVPAGSVTLIASSFGYAERTADVTVLAGQTTDQDFFLPNEAFQVEGVTATGIRRGQVLSINEKRQNLSVVDAVSADEIGKLPDLNVAESAQRIPGVTIRTDRGEGRFISIRGTAPNRNNVTFNGQPVASAAGTRATALDLVPAEMVSSIEVQKAVTPDMDANALGGSVNINTLTAFDRERSFFFSGFLYGMVHEQTTDWGTTQFPFRGNLLAGTRFGPDESWGIVASGSASRRTFNTSIASPSEWEEVDGIVAPNEFEREVEDNDRTRYAVNTNLDWRPSETTQAYARFQFSQFNDQFTNTEVQYSGGDPIPTSETEGRLEGFEVQLDIPTTEIDEALTALTLGLDQQFASDFTLNLAGTWSQGIRERLTFQPEWGEDQDFALRYDVGGDFEDLFFDDYASVSNPDNYLYTEMDIEFEDLVENTYQAGADLRWDFRSGGNIGFLKFGGQFRLRDKDIDRNENPWAGGDTPVILTPWSTDIPDPLQGGAEIPVTGDVDEFLVFFDEQQPGGGEFFDLDPVESAEEEVEVDAIVTEDVYAGYIMGSYQAGKLTATGGVRMEATTTTSERYRFVNDPTFDNAQISLQEAENDYIDWLPSLHLVYRFTDRFQARGAWSNTIGRPDYEELAAFQEVEFEELNPGVWQGAIEEGNPNLDPLRSMNFDLSLEFYPSPGTLVSVGGFYKRIQDPIYTFVREEDDLLGSAFPEEFRDEIPGFDERFFDEVEFVQLRNADEGSLLGLEVSYLQIFDFLPGLLSGFGLASNLTVMQSDVTVPGREDEDLPFFDQSDLVFNVAPYYQYGPVELRAAFNYQGEFLDAVADDAIEDIYGDERFTIDLSGRYELLDQRVQLNVYVRNLTNEAEREFQGVRNRRTFHALTGRTFEFGVSTILP